MVSFASRCALRLCLAIVSAGCSSDALPEGNVFGTVTFRGQSVTEGTISFHTDATGGFGADTKIGPDGKYRFDTGLAVGEYKVSVYPPVITDNSNPHTPPVQVYKKVANIPPKYHSPASTALTAVVKEGDNPLDFDLK